MLKKITYIFLSIFFSSCKIHKIDKDLITLNLSIKGKIPLQETRFLKGASTLHSFSHLKVSSINVKLPKGLYYLDHRYFFLSKEESLLLDREGRIYYAVGDLKSLENKVFQEILQRWDLRLDGISPQELWEMNKEITAELTHLLSNPQLDKEFVSIQKKDLEYAEKNAAEECLYGYEKEWDDKSDSYIYKKKFTPAQRRKLEDFIKNSKFQKLYQILI